VLNEDKQYFPDSEKVFPGAEVLVNEEDTQDINVPIIQTVNKKMFQHFESSLPESTFTPEFLQGMMHTPELIRNVIIVSLGCGRRTSTSWKNFIYGYFFGGQPPRTYQI
jgi:U5 small nuclear ribonucleoprotein component